MTEQQHHSEIEDVTFSDSLSLSAATVEIAESETVFHSGEDYCKKYPDYLGCLEYDT